MTTTTHADRQKVSCLLKPIYMLSYSTSFQHGLFILYSFLCQKPNDNIKSQGIFLSFSYTPHIPVIMDLSELRKFHFVFLQAPHFLQTIIFLNLLTYFTITSTVHPNVILKLPQQLRIHHDSSLLSYTDSSLM